MKQISRILGAFLSFVLIGASTLPVFAQTAQTAVINTANASDGYFTVNYNETTAKMKVGVTCNGSTVYYNYTPGTEASYTLAEGDGSYTINLFRNVSGTSYVRVTSTTVAVEMEDAFAPYLASTEEIKFSAYDSVGKRAARICTGLTSDSAKVVAIHNYIAANFTYDYDFAAKVVSGEIKTYVPNTKSVLKAKKGVCYDFSALFAAMCRSQGIPTDIEKGYLYGGYHAWNKVYVNGTWKTIDTTASIAYKNTKATSISDCTFVLSSKNGYTR